MSGSQHAGLIVGGARGVVVGEVGGGVEIIFGQGAYPVTFASTRHVPAFFGSVAFGMYWVPGHHDAGLYLDFGARNLAGSASHRNVTVTTGIFLSFDPSRLLNYSAAQFWGGRMSSNCEELETHTPSSNRNGPYVANGRCYNMGIFQGPLNQSNGCPYQLPCAASDTPELCARRALNSAISLSHNAPDQQI